MNAVIAESLPGKEPCPGHLRWSAFGASYMDTVCASVLEWPDDYQGVGLCDADNDLREGEVPCPFCDWEGFLDWEFGVGGGETVILWASDESPVPEGTEIHFHDAEALWWTATHPVRGEERVLMRNVMGEER